MTLTLIQIILLALVGSTPALVISLANHHNLGEPASGHAVRAAALFSVFGLLLATGGYWIGRSMIPQLDGELAWIVDTFWFIVGLKMIFTSFRKHPSHGKIDLSTTRTTVLAAVATGTDSLLIAVALGLLREELSLFLVYLAGLTLLFSLAGLRILSEWEWLTQRSERLLLFSGSLIMFLALIIF